MQENDLLAIASIVNELDEALLSWCSQQLATGFPGYAWHIVTAGYREGSGARWLYDLEAPEPIQSLTVGKDNSDPHPLSLAEAERLAFLLSCGHNPPPWLGRSRDYKYAHTLCRLLQRFFPQYNWQVEPLDRTKQPTVTWATHWVVVRGVFPEKALAPDCAVVADHRFPDHGEQALYRDLLQTIIQYTGCSQTAAAKALDPYIDRIWLRATDENLRRNLEDIGAL